jgi:hypothetical protein
MTIFRVFVKIIGVPLGNTEQVKTLACLQRLDATLEDLFSLKPLLQHAGIFGSIEGSHFENETPSIRVWTFSFKRDLFLLSYRMKDNLKFPLITWLNGL